MKLPIALLFIRRNRLPRRISNESAQAGRDLMAVKITRRSLMGAGAAALAFATTQTAFAQSKPKVRFSCAFPETDLRAEGYKAFAAAMKDELDLEPYWSNTLFKQGTELVALQRDNLELCNLAPADISKQIPAWSLQIGRASRRGSGW